VSKGDKTSPSKIAFLEWFIGFAEGDGSFIVTHIKGTGKDRLFFMINQEERKVMYKIKKELGFGSVFPYKQKGATYYRYQVSAKKDLTRLVHIFNGNLLATKVKKRFKSWLQAYNNRYHVTSGTSSPILYKPGQLKVSLQSDWLAGFVDAEGGFFVDLREPPKGKAWASRLVPRFSVTQKHEQTVLENIRDLIVLDPDGVQVSQVNKPNDNQTIAPSLNPLWGLPELRSGNFASLTFASQKCKWPEELDPNEVPPVTLVFVVPKDTYRLELGSARYFVELIKYFESHPLRGQRRLVFLRWKYLIANRDAFKTGSTAPEERLILLRRLISRLLIYRN
jgi:hypothetical protein